MNGLWRLIARVLEASWVAWGLRQAGPIDEQALRRTGSIVTLASLALLAWLFMDLQTPAASLFANGLGLIGLAVGISLVWRPSAWRRSEPRGGGAPDPLDLCAALILGLLLMQSVVFAHRLYQGVLRQPASVGTAGSWNLTRQAEAQAAQGR